MIILLTKIKHFVAKIIILPSKIKQFVAKMIILLTIQGNDRLGQWPLKQRIPQRQNDDDKKFLFLEDTINNGEMLNYFCTEVEYLFFKCPVGEKIQLKCCPEFRCVVFGGSFPKLTNHFTKRKRLEAKCKQFLLLFICSTLLKWQMFMRDMYVVSFYQHYWPGNSWGGQM